jgi:adenine phosphoribosyltransferase
MDYKKYIDNIPNFPKEGIMYRDIQPLLEDSNALFEVCLQMIGLLDITHVDYFAGIESRGFIFASAMATLSDKGLKLIRKAGKLPNGADLNSIEYGLEYGRDKLEMKKGQGNIVLVDDIFATGGTIAAAELLAEMSGYEVLGKTCFVDIGIRKTHDVKCLVSY